MSDRRKPILANEYESASHETLERVAEKYYARVFTKVRIADVVDIDRSGLTNADFSYALKAHFDFVVAYEDSRAAFIVEFDGPQHDTDPDQIYRDSVKDSICDHFSLPLLRIDGGFMRRIGRFTLLGYLAEVWFLNEEFYKAQERGEVPFDEIFHPAFILVEDLDREAKRLSEFRSIDEYQRELRKGLFPYNLGREEKRFIFMLMHSGILRESRFAPHLSGIDPHGYAVTLKVFDASDGLIIGFGRCRQYRFAPLLPEDLSDDLAWVNAAQKIRMWQEGILSLDTEADLSAWKKRFESWRSYK